MPTTVSREQLFDMTGHESGPTAWFRVDQERIDAFADATGDHQFIHVDPERAAQTPLGATVAHGYLTLSLLPKLAAEIAIQPERLVMAFNYGSNKVRYPNPVRSGSEVRLRTRITDVTDKGGGRILVTAEATIEIRGQDKPALAAEILTMFVVA